MQQRTRGFTLLELLITITIIGVLAGLVMYGAGAALAASRRTSCLSNLRNFGIAVNTYTEAHPIRNVPGLNGNNLPPCQDSVGNTWQALLAPYGLRDTTSFECPAGGGYGMNPLAGAEYWYMQDFFASYTLMPAETRPTNFMAVYKPAQTVLIAESGTVTDASKDGPAEDWSEDMAAPRQPYVAFPLIDTWSNTLGKSVTHGYDWGNTVANSGRGSMVWNPAVRPVGRHDGQCGVLYVDGHVGMLPIAELITPQLGQPDCLFDNQP